MKSKPISNQPLRQSIRHWARQLDCAPSTISRRLALHGIRVKHRTANPGVTMREVCYVMPHFW